MYTFRKTMDRQAEKDREWVRRTTRSGHTEAFETGRVAEEEVGSRKEEEEEVGSRKEEEAEEENAIDLMWLPVGLIGMIFIAMSV